MLAAKKGFTLVELLVVMAIVGILTAVAVPLYSNYVQEGKVTEATSQLATLRVNMEQYYQDNRTYVGGVCTPSAGTVKYFSYTCVTGANSYLITANGNAAQGMSGYIYTIDQNNNKTSTLPDSTVGATCWLLKSGDTC